MRKTPHPAQDIPATEGKESAIEAHTRHLRDQAALYAAQLIIARTINASRFPFLPGAHARGPSAKLRWYAQVQTEFQAWLAQGGFSQPDPVDVPEPSPQPTPEPCTNAYND
jgi:hypothetical protein